LLRGEGPLIRVGHRGAAALAPENTLRSFEVALAHGVDAIEFDVLDLTAGPLVLAHSRAEVTAEPPTFDEALDFLREHDVDVHVDLKLTARLDEVAAALRRHELLERAVVSSFHLESLREIAAAAPEVPVGFTFPEDRYGVSKRRALAPAVRLGTLALRRAIVRRVPAMIERAGAKALMLQHATVSAAAVERAHRVGAAVWAWTVDDPVELARLEAAGVDAVITNDPSLFEGVATLPA
jgi:glycerophosphoryl diester phosphodiesterase